MGYYSLASSLAMATAPAVGLFIISKFNFQVVSLLSTGLVIIGFTMAFTIKYREIDKQDQPKEKIALYEKTSVRPAVVIFFVTVTYGAITSFLALYALERGIENIGVFFTVYAISMLISRPSFGRVIDRLGVANATFFTGFDCGIGFGSIALGTVSSTFGYSRMFLWSVLSVVIAFILYFAIGKKHTVEKSS